MKSPILRLAEALYRAPAEKPLTNQERRRELEAYFGLFFVFLVLPLGLCSFLVMGAADPSDLSFFLPVPALLGGVGCFVAWFMSKDRIETFYLGLFAMVTALLQLRFTSAFPREFNAADSATFDVFLLAVEGGFGLLAAMAFARARAVVFQAGLPVLVGLPVIVQPLVRLLELNVHLAGLMARCFVPACLVLGAAACVLQSVAVAAHAPQARGRILRLMLYAFSFLALATESFLEADYWLQPGEGAAHVRGAELGILLGLFCLAGIEHRLKAARKPAAQAGFSLIELMIVVAVVGLLAAIAGPMYERYQAKSRQGEAKLNLSSIFASEKAFYVEYSAYVSSFEALHFAPEGERRFYTVGWSSAMSGTVNSYAGTYGRPTFDRQNVPATFGCDVATGTAALPAPVGSDEQTFTVGAAGGIRIGLGCDVWTINEEKQLVNTVTAL